MTTKNNYYSIRKFIDKTIFRYIDDMIDQEYHYHSFIFMAQAIELFGALLDTDNIHIERMSRKRFERAIERLFPVKYHSFIGKNNDYDLYKNLRCGLCHVLVPGQRVVLTNREEAKKEKNVHLSIIEDNGKKYLVLVSNNLRDDLKLAFEKLKEPNKYKIQIKKDLNKRILFTTNT